MTIAELFDQAVRFHQSGALAQGEPLYRQIIQADPSHAAALHLLGILAHQTGRPQEAAAFIGKAIAQNPNATDYHFNLGIVHKDQGQWAEASNCFREVLRLNPRHAEAQNNLGPALVEQGLALAGQGRLDEAAESWRQALRLNPNHANTHNNLGLLLYEQGSIAEATQCFQQALRINPDLADAHNTLGLALQGQGQLAGAAQCFQQAIAVDPTHRFAPWNRGCLNLLQGDFAGGWPDYEHRLARPEIVPRSCHQPSWDGSALDGKTILLYAEQGLGDTIQFIRYAELVKERGGKVVVECQSALMRVLAGVAGVDQLVPQDQPGGPPAPEKKSVLTSYDVQVPLMSLAGAIMKCLDLVICCDTSVAHLAGALGVRAWVALSIMVDWRWLLDREDSPWYPTLRLFRQDRIGEWGPVFERIAAEVKKGVS